MLVFNSTIFNCRLKFNSCLIYLHFVSDIQKYLCLQVNGLSELGSLKLIQTQGKAISTLIVFDFSAPHNRITKKNQTANRYMFMLLRYFKLWLNVP